MPATSRPASPFGERLRLWRRRRGMSQLQLATEAETTPRYLSFLETGRSRPGRAIVLRLARCLELPVREQNTLLLSAGLPAAFDERDLDDEALRPLRMAIDAILARHEPFPACAMDGLGRVVRLNEACRRFMPGVETQSPEQGLDAFLAPGPGREMVENFAEVAWAYCDRLQREAARTGDPRLRALFELAHAHLRDVPRPVSAEGPVLVVRFRFGDRVIRTFTTVMRFDTPHEVTLSELRVELVFPMDDEADAFFRSLAE